MISYDIVIPIAENDVAALKSSLPHIIEKIGKTNKIVVIAKKTVEKYFKEYSNITFLDENSVVSGVTFEKVRMWIEQRYPKAVRRTGWYFQQFLKWGYSEICKNDYYLVWDSDTIPLKNLSFFNEEGTPYLDVISAVKYDEVYDDVIKAFWRNDEVPILKDHSYITEHLMFNKGIVKNLIHEIEISKIKGVNFAEKIINAIPINSLNLSGFSEFETYSLYVLSKFKDSYEIREWKNLRHGRTFLGKDPTAEQLYWVSNCFDVISIEDFDRQFIICKLLCSDVVIKRIKFKWIYSIVNPLIVTRFELRMILRGIIRK